MSGISFQWTDGLFGMSIAPSNDGYSVMYFHPLSSTMEYSVSTKILRDSERANSPGKSIYFNIVSSIYIVIYPFSRFSLSDNFKEFRALGSRGHNGQSSVSFLDPDTGVLFYALTNLNAIACWKPRNMFTLHQQGLIYQNGITMVFPNDLKVIKYVRSLFLNLDKIYIYVYILDQQDPDLFSR